MRLLLVCGGRWYAHPVTHTGNSNVHYSEQHRLVWRNLTQLLQQIGFDGVVEGAATGADTAAHEWAVDHGLMAIRVPPQRGESPLLRNIRMWRTWRQHIYNVAAFPGGEGTENMVSIVASESPIRIWRLPSSEQQLNFGIL